MQLSKCFSNQNNRYIQLNFSNKKVPAWAILSGFGAKPDEFAIKEASPNFNRNFATMRVVELRKWANTFLAEKDSLFFPFQKNIKYLIETQKEADLLCRVSKMTKGKSYFTIEIEDLTGK